MLSRTLFTIYYSPFTPFRSRGDSPFTIHHLRFRRRGFTLVELLVALFILALLAVMSYRGLAAVLDTREHVQLETEKWRSVAAFFVRFERDVHLAAPRPVRAAVGMAPAWYGLTSSPGEPRLEFSRFASVEGIDAARRVAYRLNDQQQVELWLWPGLDAAPGILPARYAVLNGVARFEVHYLDANRLWQDTWPGARLDTSIPRAVRLRLVLASGEDIVRVFELGS